MVNTQTFGLWLQWTFCLSSSIPFHSSRICPFAYAGGAPHHIPEHFLDIIGMFSNIDELSMIYPRFEHTTLVASDIAGQLEMSLANAIPKELRVKKIVIEDTTFGTQFWLETLRRTASVQTLFSVTVLTSFSWDLGPVGFLLAAVGSNLRSLKLDVTGILSLSDAPSARICGLLCLSSCTGLKHFSLRTKSPTDAPTAESWERICNMVAAVAAHGTLETFTLSGYFGPLLTEFHNFREWAPLHEALSASSALRKVAFVDEAWRTISPRVVALVAPRLRDYHLALPEDVEVRVQADEPQGE
ncbi:hypothetical protein BC835DRAFT_1399177 [Cytidiella melzeri]|nr:hypothetical protein BC835DRAFT_1399177 [Cytidiella melzeri]